MSDESTTKEPNQNDTHINGILNDTHECSKKARNYANKVIKSDEWDLNDVDLTKVHFETSTRVKRRHGLAKYKSDRQIIRMSEHTYNNTSWSEYKETVRHELVHVWQRQNDEGVVDGEFYDDVTTGHTGCWYAWEDIMNISRTNNYYRKTKEDYRYILKCPVCGGWEGKHRMSKKVKTIATSETWYHKCRKNKKSDDWTYRVLVNPDETHMLRLDDVHWSCLKERHKDKIREFAKGNRIPEEAEPLE